MARRSNTGRPRGLRYGIDAPYVPAALGAAGMVAVVLGLVVSGSQWWFVVGFVFWLQAAVFLHTTLRGKFVVWERLLDELMLSGDETSLDIGCGRGAVLLATAKRLPQGVAHGVDLWRSLDQSGNSEAVTTENAEAEGVAGRVELHTADMTALPFPDGMFDVVTSSLAIHNIPSRDGQLAAIDEAFRVLRPGGRLVVADIRGVRDYAVHLHATHGVEVPIANLGPNFWFSGPWQATSVLCVGKP